MDERTQLKSCQRRQTRKETTASPLRAMTLAETQENAHMEEAVLEIVTPEQEGLRDAGCLEAPGDFLG